MTGENRDRARTGLSDMLHSGKVDGVVSSLARKYSAPVAMVEDAVASAVLIVLERAEDHEIRDLGAYFYRTASNELLGLLRRQNRQVTLPDDDDDSWGGLQAPASDFDGRDLLRWLKSQTAGWNRNMAAATNIVLEYAFAGMEEELTAELLAEELQLALGEYVSPANARQWKSRGLRRLKEALTTPSTSTQKSQNGTSDECL